MARRIVVIALALLGLVPTVALANGRYPSAITLHFKPGSTRDIVVGATWGMLITSDGGATWRWSCEDAVGYGGTFDPDYVMSSTGRIFATTAAEGLRHTDDGCTWSTTPLGVNLVSSVTVAPGGDVWAAGYAELDYRIFRSDDDGATFEPVALTGRDEGAWWESLEVAPGDDQRVYLAGYRFVADTKEFLLYRSDNGGGAWRALPVTAFAASSQSLLQIVAISPDDPDLVFARLTRREGAVGDAIYRSDDAGASWARVLEPGDAMAGIAVRAVSGGPAATTAEVIVSTPTMGSHRSTNGGVDFVRAPASPVKGCLVERPGDRMLIGCGDNLAPDLVGLTQSGDGLAWTTLLQFRNVTAPIACVEGTEQRDVCQDQLWCGMKDQLSIVSDVIACPATGVDAGLPDAGAGGDDDGGGGCCDGGAGASGLATALLVLAAGSGARRRRN